MQGTSLPPCSEASRKAISNRAESEAVGGKRKCRSPEPVADKAGLFRKKKSAPAVREGRRVAPSVPQSGFKASRFTTCESGQAKERQNPRSRPAVLPCFSSCERRGGVARHPNAEGVPQRLSQRQAQTRLFACEVVDFTPRPACRDGERTPKKQTAIAVLKTHGTALCIFFHAKPPPRSSF